MLNIVPSLGQPLAAVLRQIEIVYDVSAYFQLRNSLQCTDISKISFKFWRSNRDH